MSRIAQLAVTLLCLMSLPTLAERITVSPEGPLTVQQAIDQAQPGDTVFLKPGIYRERVKFTRSGQHGKPITLEGEDGAVLDGSDPITLDWQPAFDIGPGVYRADAAWKPYHFVANDKTLTSLRWDRVTRKARNEAWKWPAIFRDGPEGRTLKGVGGLILHRDATKDIIVRFHGDLDPTNMTWHAAPKQAVVHIENVDRIVIRNLTIRHGWYGVNVSNSMGVVVEHCQVGPTHHGIWLGTNSDRATVRFNKITQQPWSVTGPTPNQARENWTNWIAHKRGGHWDSFGIELYKTAGGHRVHDNFIHDHWGGIESKGEGDHNRGSEIHHNRIINISDDALEPTLAVGDTRWHNNRIENAICGFRIKHVTVGPVFAYHNIFLRCTEDFRNYGEKKLKPVEVYVYHNTSTARRAAYVSNKVHGIGTPNYYYLNNLFYAGKWWHNSGKSVDPNWHGAGNVFVPRTYDEAWMAQKQFAHSLGIDVQSKWIDDGNPGFADAAKDNLALTHDSPARDAAIDISTIVKRPLPGLEAGTMTDAGALQFGQSMPIVPRPADQVDFPPAGSWPDVHATRRTVTIAKAKPKPVEKPPVAATELQDLTGLTNLLSNGDFSQAQDNGFPAGWGWGSKRLSHQVSIDTDNTPIGVTHALRVVINGTAGRSQGAIAQRVSIKPNTKYALAAQMRSDINKAAMLQVKLFKAGKEVRRVSSKWSSKQWLPSQVMFDSGDADTIAVLCRFKQSAQAQGSKVHFAALKLAELQR